MADTPGAGICPRFPITCSVTKCKPLATGFATLRFISKMLGGGAERFLFQHERILDYPYLLITRERRNGTVSVSTRAEVMSVERGIDMLHFTSGYYHWLVDGVPRILDLIDDGTDFDKYPLIMPPLEVFQRQLLESSGNLFRRQVVIVGKDDWCHVGECVFPTATFHSTVPGLDDYWTHPNGDMLLRIRERILDGCQRRNLKKRETHQSVSTSVELRQLSENSPFNPKLL